MKFTLAAIFSLLSASMGLAQSVDQNNAMVWSKIREGYLQASCGVLLLAKSDPEMVKADAIGYYDALVFGTGVGRLSSGTVMKEYRVLCGKDPELSVGMALRNAVLAVEAKEFGTK